ncbi:hypothetical protein PPERSA_02416 [Pseudocohnilembus persalinus]|uniref:Uncharacterized protein n=1 Tax=Pseudocohnilembus persalinus TaxID=266149 RepID=A0A0V0QAR6_PSEPJ|nr:hypothetical protein PPERSA_02416 [Pseudocohnilembus persalinus]|eukprot:KRW99304.1 hypothetical protein PPERSA_02416 [Pseudocohnilembus persalinus]
MLRISQITLLKKIIKMQLDLKFFGMSQGQVLISPKEELKQENLESLKMEGKKGPKIFKNQSQKPSQTQFFQNQAYKKTQSDPSKQIEEEETIQDIFDSQMSKLVDLVNSVLDNSFPNAVVAQQTSDKTEQNSSQNSGEKTININIKHNTIFKQEAEQIEEEEEEREREKEKEIKKQNSTEQSLKEKLKTQQQQEEEDQINHSQTNFQETIDKYFEQQQQLQLSQNHQEQEQHFNTYNSLSTRNQVRAIDQELPDLENEEIQIQNEEEEVYAFYPIADTNIQKKQNYQKIAKKN